MKLDDAFEKYLDQKFKNLEDKIETLSKNLDTHVVTKLACSIKHEVINRWLWLIGIVCSVGGSIATILLKDVVKGWFS